MPSKQFLEDFPLYRRYRPAAGVPFNLGELPRPSINMACKKCDANQTFVHVAQSVNAQTGSEQTALAGGVIALTYLCSHCSTFVRYFSILADQDLKWLMKVGQHPPWETKGNLEIDRLLGNHAELYSKGYICEFQGFGIGAFGYYRRIVESIIDELLEDVSRVMAGQELERYREGLAKTKATIVAQEKIDLVKDLLPPVLRPSGMNPLSALHSALSEGLHSESDEVCLTQSQVIREVLLFLVNQVAVTRDSAKAFTEGMKKILNKKAAGK